MVIPVGLAKKYKLWPSGDHCGLMFLELAKLGAGVTSRVMGSMIASLAGFVSLVMMMTGHEYVAAKMGLAVAAMNILLNWALIPSLGAEGAAIATATSTVVGNGILVIWVWRRMGLDGTVVGLRRANPAA